MFLLSSSASRSEDDPDPCPDLEAAAANTAATANIAMHPVTGAFANPSHETAFAAQLFRMAFPCHLFLISLTDAMIIWSSLSAPPDLWPLESMIAFLGTLCLVGRVQAHQSMDDTVRGQRLGSWTWIAILALVVSIDLIGYVVAPAADCAFQRTHNLAGFAGLTIALVNGSYGLGFWRKLGLIGIYMLHDGVCSVMVSESLLVVGVVVAHMAEMHLRHIYVEKQRQAEDKQRLEERTDEESRRLEERMEQLQAEKERLLYDVQRRGHPIDDDNRSAIRRGLLAGLSHSYSPVGPAPSDSLPPSLPPGPPSSTSSGSVAPPLGSAWSSQSTVVGVEAYRQWHAANQWHAETVRWARIVVAQNAAGEATLAAPTAPAAEAICGEELMETILAEMETDGNGTAAASTVHASAHNY